MRNAKVLCIIIGTLAFGLLSGCTALREPGELHWQTMHAVDTLQTLSLTQDPRYREVESAWLIGERPKKEVVYAWSVGLALAHAGVTQLLIDNDFPKLSKVWQYVTLSSLCRTVGQNAAIGVNIGQSNAGPYSRVPDFSTWSQTRF